MSAVGDRLGEGARGGTAMVAGKIKKSNKGYPLMLDGRAKDSLAKIKINPQDRWKKSRANEVQDRKAKFGVQAVGSSSPLCNCRQLAVEVGANSPPHVKGRDVHYG